MIPGNYTLQLVKIDKSCKKAFIIAAKNFSIESKYTEEELSNLRAWLFLGEDPNSAHFETLQFNAPAVLVYGFKVQGIQLVERQLYQEYNPMGRRILHFTGNSALQQIRRENP